MINGMIKIRITAVRNIFIRRQDKTFSTNY